MVLFGQAPYSFKPSAQDIWDRPMTCLLPQLQSLTWNVEGVETYDVVWIMSSALRSLTIRGPDSVIKALLSFANETCRKIREFYLLGPHTDQTFGEGTVSQAISLQCGRAERLLISDGQIGELPGLIRALAACRHLRSLTLGSKSYPLPSAVAFRLPGMEHFAQLDALNLTARASTAVDVVTAIRSWSWRGGVTSLSIHLTDTDSDLAPIFRSSVFRGHINSLQNLRITGGNTQGSDGINMTLLEAEQFPNLSVLDIDIYGILSLRNYILLEIGAHFPNLTRLWLTPRPRGCVGRYPSSAVTLEGLFDLTELCGNLQILGVLVDATNTCDYIVDSSIKPAKELRELDVGVSSITEPTAVGAIFSLAFPKLQSFSWTSKYTEFGYNETFSKHWDAVWNVAFPTTLRARRNMAQRVGTEVGE